MILCAQMISGFTLKNMRRFTGAKFKMADSDDEDTLACFGTPFEPLEEGAPRKKAVPIHEQIVTDTEGRRRFHGAFTGGFSAGYFNTVGTKEGWQPSTFVSSRSKKIEQRAQRPEDFMDEEDMGEFGIAPKRITAKEEFLSHERELQSRRKRLIVSDDSQGSIPGESMLQDLVLPVKMSVGVNLLKKMGWKEGQGVGPRERRTKKKVYSCCLPRGLSSSQTIAVDKEEEEEDVFAVGLLFAPKDVDTFMFTPKDDKHGLGYKGLDPSTALFGREDWLGIDPVSTRAGKKGISGQAFGVGAFEEDDDEIYTRDHMSNYDLELTADHSTGLHGWTGPPKENTRGGALSIFTATPKAMEAMKSFRPPVVPRDFSCIHKFDNSITETKPPEETQQKRKTLTAKDRGEMLGEEPLPVPKKSVFEYLSKEDKERVWSLSQNTTQKPHSTASSASPTAQSVTASAHWTSKLWSAHSGFKPFAKDSAKQARYEEFLKSRQGEHVSQHISDSGLTEWEREREKEEFARAAALYRPLNTTMAARFTTAKHADDHRTVYEEVPAQESSDSSDQAKAAKIKMFGKLTRDNFEWHPNHVLCKRFNIPNPYPGSDVVGVPRIRRPKFTLGDFIKPQTVASQAPRAITYDQSSSISKTDRQSEKLGKASASDGVAEGLKDLSESMSVTSDLTTKVSVGPSSIPVSVSSSTGNVSTNLTSNESEQTTTKEAQNEADFAPKRLPMDLFKAIFADSSADESEGSEGEENAETESSSIHVSENKSAEEDASRRVDAKPELSNMTDCVLSDRKTLEEGLSSTKLNGEEQKAVETEHLKRASSEIDKLESLADTFGPAPPPSLRNKEPSRSLPGEKRVEDSAVQNEGDLERERERDSFRDIESSRSIQGKKHAKDRVQNEEELERKRRIKKHKRKDTKKRYSESSESEDDGSFRKMEPSRSLSGEKRFKDRAQNEEDVERKRHVKKEKRKDTKKRYSDFSESEDEYRSKHRHKHKEKRKHKHKSKNKHRHEEKEKFSDKKEIEKSKSNQAEEKNSVPDDKQILSKLKNLQNLEAGKRMRAADFM